MKDAREVAVLIIEDVLYNKAYSNITLNSNIKKYEVYSDEAFIRELVYGVIENKIYLEYILKKVSKVRMKKIHSKIYSTLLMGIYQMYFLDKVPDNAAVNESVKLAKKFGNKGSIGFVNGVLRNISRDKENLGKISAKDKKEYISIKYSHPMWLVEYWEKQFGLDFTEDLCKANNQVPHFAIRFNRLTTSKENLKEELINLGYSIRDSKISKDTIIIDNPKNIFKTDLFKNGLFTVQGEGSTLVGEVINPKEDSLVLDVCSAPGGKSIHLGEIMNNTGRVIARDIYEHRLKLVRENTKRLKLKNIETEEFDAISLDKTLVNMVDYCLVDAPCSGLGTIMGSPEIKYNRSYDDIIELSKLQYEILSVSKNYVKSGGTLVYSTCTINREENESIIDKFLKENEDFKKEGDMIRIFPNIDETDGFFICKLVKK